MTWGNAWAFIGLAALALPVLIHLLSRGHARVHRFPTLRFLEASRLLPTRRTRVHDLLLLAVRAGILAAAVIALAQPVWRTANRTRALGRTLARAIVVDTSASMNRVTLSGDRAIDSAHSEARRFAAQAQTSTVIATHSPSAAIPAAVEWLNRQQGRGELVVVSDFQDGAVTAAGLSVLPHAFGVKLARIPVKELATPVELMSRFGTDEMTARTTVTLASTNVDWTLRAPLARRGDDQLSVLAGPGERARADAAIRAAGTIAVRLPLDSVHTIAVVLPQFAQRAELVRASNAPLSRWATDVVARLRSDSLLLVVASASADVPTAVDTVGGIVVARTAAGRPAVMAKQDTARGHERLLLFSFADAGSLTSAALIAATNTARSLALPLTELDPSTLSDATLASWQREPAAEAPPRNNANARGGTSDGRWLWLLALLLLALETWMRRALPPASAHGLAADSRERAA
ncbi:MAG TPA: BatA domain-containing protein [Gemmatimonadaceae bacterium]|nr:BatA domain-containing protein [Gemmatimonadaceae bacterium]